MPVPKPNYTQTPNRFIDEYMHQVSPIATCVYMAICRKTFGYHKDTDEISLSQIIKLSGLSKNTVLKGTAELEDLQLLNVTRKGKGRKATNTYGLSFDNVRTPENTIDNGAQNEPIEENKGSYDEPINNNDKKNGAQNEPFNPVNGARFEHTKEININKEYKEKDLESAGSSVFHKIDKIFQAGSKALTGKPYYKDAKESKQIKLLEPRYIQDRGAFIELVKKYYDMLTKLDDNFWNTQAFTPSAFNSHYNRVLCYKLPSSIRKCEEQKQKSESDILFKNYGHLNEGELKFLLDNKTISKEQFDQIIASKPLEVSA